MIHTGYTMDTYTNYNAYAYGIKQMVECSVSMHFNS